MYMYNYVDAVLKEVENKLENFREDLRQKLLSCPSSLEEQKRIIKCVA